MNKLLTLSAVSALLAATPALAQETYDWSGVYLGAHVGYSAMGAATDSLDCTLFGDTEFANISGAESTPLESLTISGPIANVDALCNDPESGLGGLFFLTGGPGFVRPTTQSADPEFMYWTNDGSNYEGGLGANVDFSQVEGDPQTSRLDQLVGWEAGAQAGVLVQSDQLVFGAEISAALTGIQDSRDAYSLYGGESYGDDVEYFGVSTTHTQLNVDWIGLATARAGIALDRTLLTANAGLAIVGTTLHNTVAGEETACYSDDYDPECGIGGIGSLLGIGGGSYYEDITNSEYGGVWSSQSVNVGWTVGGQVDVALDDSNSVFVGYNYVNVKDIRYVGAIDTPAYDIDYDDDEITNQGGTAIQTYEYDLGLHLLKAGFNHKF